MVKARQALIAATVLIVASGAVVDSCGCWGGGRVCVGGRGCFATVQAAVDAAPVGATSRINAGRFAGGVRIGKSRRLVGAGASRTVISGGDSRSYASILRRGAPPWASRH